MLEEDKTPKEDEAPKEDSKPKKVSKEKPVVEVKRSPREVQREALLKKCEMLKPKILKLYKHEGFPRTKFEALTPTRILQNLGLDETDEELLTAVGVAWHQLSDAGKVGSTSMYKPLDEKPPKLPF